MQEKQVAARLAPGTRPVLWRHLARDDEAFARGRVNPRDAAEIICPITLCPTLGPCARACTHKQARNVCFTSDSGRAASPLKESAKCQ
jgi:hypothetical protein